MSRALLLDLAERAGWTFMQAFLAVVVVGDVSTVRTAVIAGAAAVLALVKGVAASRVGDRTASTVPPRMLG